MTPTVKCRENCKVGLERIYDGFRAGGMRYALVLVKHLLLMPLFLEAFFRLMTKEFMIKSELIAAITKKRPAWDEREIERAVQCIIQSMISELAHGGRVEVRGFGSFSVKTRQPRMGRNPKTGMLVAVPVKHLVHFKAGLALRQRVCASKGHYQIR